MDYKFDFKNKAVLITGAASGIGLESVRAFLQNGATVYMTDSKEASLIEAADVLKTEYKDCKIVTAVCDITKEDDVRKLIDIIKKNTQSIDILINNAGISHSVYSVNENKEDWDNVVNVNLTSQFLIAKNIAVEFFIPQKSGKIVNMCSLGGIIGIPAATAYSASKGGVLQMTKSLSAEWARFGIQVNAVCPGFVDTPLIAENKSDEKWFKYITMRTPMHRLANPDDVAGAVLFLSSHLSDYITGTSIIIDGGFSSGS